MSTTVKPEATPKRTDTAKQEPKPSLGDYATLGNLGGTTGGARHVRLPDGSEKVIKRSTGESHLREEYTANRLYRVMDVLVPNVELSRDAQGKLVQVADYIEGTPLSELSGDDSIAALNDMKRGFVADALLGNWDVTGLANDNIIWDGKRAYRIDNGGALRYRAQGALKSSAFGTTVREIDTMRDESTLAGETFGSDVTDVEIRKQVRDVVAKRDAIFASIDDTSLRRIMEGRINNLSKRYLDASPETDIGIG